MDYPNLFWVFFFSISFCIPYNTALQNDKENTTSFYDASRTSKQHSSKSKPETVTWHLISNQPSYANTLHGINTNNSFFPDLKNLSTQLSSSERNNDIDVTPSYKSNVSQTSTSKSSLSGKSSSDGRSNVLFHTSDNLQITENNTFSNENNWKSLPISNIDGTEAKSKRDLSTGISDSVISVRNTNPDIDTILNTNDDLLFKSKNKMAIYTKEATADLELHVRDVIDEHTVNETKSSKSSTKPKVDSEKAMADLGIVVPKKNVPKDSDPDSKEESNSFFDDVGIRINKATLVKPENVALERNNLKDSHNTNKPRKKGKNRDLMDMGVHLNKTVNATFFNETGELDSRIEENLADLGVRLNNSDEPSASSKKIKPQNIEIQYKSIGETDDLSDQSFFPQASRIENKNLNIDSYNELLEENEIKDFEINRRENILITKTESTNKEAMENSQNGDARLSKHELEIPNADIDSISDSSKINKNYVVDDGNQQVISCDDVNSDCKKLYNNTNGISTTAEITLKNESKNFANILNKTFLKNLFKRLKNDVEIIKEVNVRSRGSIINQDLKTENGTITLRLQAFDETYEYELQLLSSNRFPENAYVWIETSTLLKSKLLSNVIDDLKLYQGKIENGDNSFAVGYLVEDLFIGIVMLPNGKTIYFEPSGKHKHYDFSKNEDYYAYTGSHVYSSTCARLKNTSDICIEELYSDSYSCKTKDQNKIVCHVGFENKLYTEKSTFTFNNNNNPQNISTVPNATCLMELISDPSHFVEQHNKIEKEILREMIMLAIYANWVFKHMDFDGDGRADNLNLQIGRIVLRHTNFSTNRTMEHFLSKLQTEVPQTCISVFFVGSDSKKEPLSLTYKGGMCKKNDIENRLPTNVAVINTMDSIGYENNVFIQAYILTKTIGQMLGSSQTCPLENHEHLFVDDWRQFFSQCEKNSMGKFLNSDGQCLVSDNGFIYKEKKPPKPEKRCGNGIVEDGEECDCGSRENCKSQSSCCVPPGKKNQCKYDIKKGYQCEWNEVCCTKSCKLIPASWKFFCGYGEPSCSPNQAFCNGTSSKCPVDHVAARAYNGHSCWPGPLTHQGAATCKDGYCNSSVCQDADLIDCKCAAHSGEECRICCKSSENGLCVPAEHHGLKSKSTKYHYRHHGTACTEIKFGECNQRGICTRMLTSDASPNTIIHGFGNNENFFQHFALVAFFTLTRLILLRLFL